MKPPSKPLLLAVLLATPVQQVSSFTCGNREQPSGGCAQETKDTVWVVLAKSMPGDFTYDCLGATVPDAPANLKTFMACCNPQALPTQSGVSKMATRPGFESLCTSFYPLNFTHPITTIPAQ
ncbi:hypothetical protein PGT21_024016 [Puccinia graminis f. sp. tritici]|uniref:Uncharacterized protein n=1 Tax=Puccinia graminis f. sp. tritici TaxID=56615 RepID=A0A5B0N6L7_PUCGR|nr:hypothetical protein PGT21_024016 [Puccinia graminis f. sp. tritici]KAA1092306.1 hypothetical protein PGTUg99_017331 [Puccinia graminis f. sp. tritici]